MANATAFPFHLGDMVHFAPVGFGNVVPSDSVKTRTFDLATGAKLELHADTRWSSSYYLSNYDTGVQYRQDSFSRSNANLTYVSASGKLQTELFVTNIENKIQATGGVYAYPNPTTFPPGYNFQGYGQVSQPEFWGIRETVKF